MNDSKAPDDPAKPDLTSTIHLSALRSVPKPRPLEEIFSVLSLEEREIVSQLPQRSAMLIVIAGPNKGARFLIDSDETFIGRDPKSEIFLDDVQLSINGVMNHLGLCVVNHRRRECPIRNLVTIDPIDFGSGIKLSTDAPDHSGDGGRELS